MPLNNNSTANNSDNQTTVNPIFIIEKSLHFYATVVQIFITVSIWFYNGNCINK